ncbi:helix-turn-helix domain-containing protein [Dysgonomonas sp. ZJ279]|uniref:helix-turn-helix domain-containing protein n=1 Tax=Dysgonomonas sp. ZJ279 TaxID=2709796 RepID=UPI0013EA7277|nr:helix-turn-helix domain-containing protein [Dysgonomonas sp. ZJ279]
MELLDRKSAEISQFFTALDEVLDSVNQALKNRTPHLNGEKFLTNKDVCKMLCVSLRTLQDWRDNKIIPFIQIKGKILYCESVIIKRIESNFDKIE